MKRFLMLFTAILMAVFATGCMTTPDELRHSETMYDKQIAATEKAKPVPIFQMVGLPGQSIELKGVQSISVYNPTDATNKVPEFKAQVNQGLRIAEKLIDGTVNVILGKFGLDAKLSDNSRSISAGDSELAKQINRSNTPVNPFVTAP